MSQPKWNLIAQLGDADPIDYGGYFVYVDETGKNDPQAVYLESPADDDSGVWTLYRFDIVKCTLTIEDDEQEPITTTILSDNPFHPTHPVWFASDLSSVATMVGVETRELREQFCSDDIIERAQAYRAIGEYHGWANLDHDPLVFKVRAEVEDYFDIESEEQRATRRPINTEGMRHHELSDRPIKLADAMDNDRLSRYGVEAKTGDWIVYREISSYQGSTGNDITHYRQGRVLGRVDAEAMGGQYPSPEIKGHIAVLALSDNLFSAYVRWVKPEDVATVNTTAPAKLLAWITGPLPKAETVYRLSRYGSLNERYIDHVSELVAKWEHEGGE